MSYSVMIVEDDVELQNYLQNILVEQGYKVTIANNGVSAFKIFEKLSADIVILDLQLPDISGETVCKELKKQSPQLPIIFLTAEDTTSSIVKSLDNGADDYITKPFIVEELLARIRVRLRNDNKLDTSVIQVGDLILNKKTHQVKRGKKIIILTPKEFKLLEYFMSNKDQVLSREQILNRVWQYHYEIESRVVDMYVGFLRKKISNGFEKKMIHAVRGFGYMFKE